MRLILFLIIIITAHLNCRAQNTTGTLLNTNNSFNGLTLFSPRTTLDNKQTYLINNCGNIVHSWQSNFPLFSTDYIAIDGSLWRSVVDNQSSLDIPGNTGRIEHIDWDGNIIWASTISDTNFSFHHDFVVLENGNILLLVAFRMSEEQAIQAGRDPMTIANGELYEERVWEIETVGSDSYNIIWEWRSWDHIIQDFDNTKLNFGAVAENPQLIDFNYGTSFGEADWWHSNSLSFNQERNQISISNRNLDEFIIIDHSTTTAEASSSSGGNSGLGGDILYRYGNPAAYRQGTVEDKKLDAMHDVHFIASGSPDAGKIQIFNNGPDFGFSAIQIISPDFNESTFNYVYNGGAYGPENVTSEYVDPIDPSNFFAAFLSGSQQLPNGNLLITNGPAGLIFEVTLTGETVWQYQSPVGNSEILSDGANPTSFQTRLYRSIRYPIDYEGFNGRDLTPNNPIELNPFDFECTILSTQDFDLRQVFLYPNPVKEKLYSQSLPTIKKITLLDLSGKILLTSVSEPIDVTNLSNGLYIATIYLDNGSQFLQKIIKN